MSDDPRLPQRFENPARCGVCFAPWLFDTDELGRVHHRHPPKKCVPPTYAADTPERQFDDVDAHPKKQRRCAECRALMLVSTYGMRRHKITCSERCRKARDSRQKLASQKRKREELRRLWKAVA